jgi:tetratricopeptide (TPR) repeat protein
LLNMPSKQRTTLVALVVLSIGLIVLFLALPHHPTEVREKMEVPMNADSVRLAQAIELVNGPNPMEGITILRDLVAKDSANVEAHYWLGIFSLKSGQIPKAIDRFKRVIRIDPNYLPAYIDLGSTYVEMDSLEVARSYFLRAKDVDSTNNYALLFCAQTEEKLALWADAKQNYEQLLRHNEDTIVTKRVKEFIQNIDKKLNP